MNHKYVEDARQVVIMQANVLEKLVKQKNEELVYDQEHKQWKKVDARDCAALMKEIKRLRLLATKLVEIRNALVPTPGLLTWNKGNEVAMKNWKPSTTGSFR